MSKKNYLTLIIIILSITIISTNFNSLSQYTAYLEEKINPHDIQALNQYNPKEKIYSNNSLNLRNSSKLSPDNPQIQKYFTKVAEVPYKANYTSTVAKSPATFWKDNSGDCDDKSVAFADYLYKIGAKDVKLVLITHESGKYAHECVMWKNHIFDATAEPPIYNMDPTKYFNFIENYGFNLWIDYPYDPKNWAGN